MTTVDGWPSSQPPSCDSRPSYSNSALDAEVVQEPRAPAVRREQVDPRQHPHQVVDPERQHEQQQQERRASGRRGARRSTRPGSRSAAERQRERDVGERAHEDREERAARARCCAASRAGSRRSSRAGSRTARARERVLVAEGDAEHGVERRPGRRRSARRRPGAASSAPDPAGFHAQPALNFAQALCQSCSPSTLSASSSWLVGELVGPHDGAPRGSSGSGLCLTSASRVDRRSAAACSR